MEGLLVLFALAGLLGGPILALAAFLRARRVDELRQTVAALELEVNDLKRRVHGLSRPSPPPVPEPPKLEAKPPAPPPPRVPEPPRVEAKPPAPPPRVPEPPRVKVEPPAEPPAPRVDWERWIGIRGAAVLGGIVLALAGLLFFQYSIQHGLITPTMRVVMGLVVGVAAIVGSEWLRPRGYKATPEGLAGAGVVVLYAALWAAHALYHLIPMFLGFGLMALVTVTCGLLAVKRSSKLVAVLGLVGGFATPLLLSSGQDRPIGLFGYVLLLDVGLLAVGRTKRWSWLGLLGLVGTTLLQMLWIGVRMGPERLALGLAILGLFAVVFTIASLWVQDEEREASRWAQAGGLLAPFVFAAYFASRVDLGPHLWPVAILLAILGAGASWVGRREQTPWLGFAAAAGSLGVFTMWQLTPGAGTVSPWEPVAIAVGLATVFHLFVELDPDSPGFEGPAPAAIVTASGVLAVLVCASSRGFSSWSWLAGWLALAVILYRHAAFPQRAVLQVAAAIGVALGLSMQHRVHFAARSLPPHGVFLAVAVAAGIVAQATALFRRGADVKRFADHAAAAYASIFAALLIGSRFLETAPPALAHGVPLVLGVLVLLVAARRGAGGWSLVALGVTALAQTVWVGSRPWLAESAGDARVALGLELASVTVFAAWPFLAGPRLQVDRLAWYAAALAGPLAFFPARRLWPVAVGSGSIGLLAIVLGGVAFVAVFGLRRAAIPDALVRKSALVWFSAVAIGFASVAIPLQLEKSWITIGWAMLGVALIALWRRLDHPGLKWLALAHLAAATVRLIPTDVLLNSYPRSSIRIVNWLLYTYLVPAAALFLAARWLAPDEVGRARPWEETLYDKRRPVGAIAATIGGIVVVFVWLNVAIADWFAEGSRLTLQFGRSPARDLTVSIVWALYALSLLGFGMARAKTGLRWVSLCFLVVTIGKVFLYDLGELRDLYRVISLVGLAISLLLVSLLYQRFVFRRAPQEQP